MEVEKYEKEDSQSWFEIMQEMTEKIGKTLENNDWENEYRLYCINNGKIVNKVEDLVNAFEVVSSNNSLEFTLKVEFGFLFHF